MFYIGVGDSEERLSSIAAVLTCAKSGIYRIYLFAAIARDMTLAKRPGTS